MPKNEQQTSLAEEVRALGANVKPVEAASKRQSAYDDDEPVTVIWKSWGTSGMPRKKVTYFDHQTFEGGVGRRIPYRIAKKWIAQGHGIHVLPVNAEESDFIRITGHAPLQDDEAASLLRAMSPEKIAALLGPEALDKVVAMHKQQ